MGLAVRDRVGLVALEDPAAQDRVAVDRAVRDRAALADRVGLADRVDLADRVGLAALVGLVGQEDTNPAPLVDTNRVAPGAMADMGPAALASLGVLVGLEGMDLAAPEDQGVPNLAGRAALASLGVPEDMDLGVPNLAGRAPRDLGRAALSRAHLGRAALSRAYLRRNLPDLHLTRARPHRMPAHLHLTRARPHRMPAHLHQIPARLRAPTHPRVATHQPVRTRQAVAIHPVAATPVAATPVAVAHPAEATADSEGAKPLDCEFIWQSSGFGRFAPTLHLKSAPPMRIEGPHEKRRTVCRSNRRAGRRFGISRSGRCNGG